MTTLIVCIRRREGMSREEFSIYWRERHGPLVRACHEFTRHLVSYDQYHLDHVSPAAAQFGVAGDYDGIAILTFKSPEALSAAFSEPRYFSDVQPDELNFIASDECLSFVTHKTSMLATSS